MEAKQAPVHTDTIFSYGKLCVTRRDRIAFLSALISGLLVHLYAFTNKLVNVDDVVSVFTDNDFTTSGRWLLKYASSLSGTFSMPWVIGVLSLAALAVTAVFLVRMLEIRKPFFIVLASFALVSFPSVGNTFAYLFTADAYFFALALAVIGAYLSDRYRFGFLAAGVLFACSMGIYQAYVCFAIALFALRYLSLLLSQRMTNRQALAKLGQYALSLAIGGALYYLILQFVLRTRGLVMNTYMGLDRMGSFSLAALPSACVAAYREFFRFAFLTSGEYSGWTLCICHLSTGLLIVLLFVLLYRRAKSLPVLQKVFAWGVLLLMPLLLNSIYLFGSTSVHILMLHAVSVIYLAVLVLAEQFVEGQTTLSQKLPRVLSGLSAAVVLVSSLCWSLYTNEGYFELALKRDNMYAMAVRMVYRMENDPAYVPGMPVTVLGDCFYGNYSYSKGPEFGELGYAMGFGGAKEYEYLAGEKHFKEFVRVYVGVKWDWLDYETRQALLASEQFRAMPCYPSQGCVQMIDGVLVLKAGEEEHPAELAP